MGLRQGKQSAVRYHILGTISTWPNTTTQLTIRSIDVDLELRPLYREPLAGYCWDKGEKFEELLLKERLGGCPIAVRGRKPQRGLKDETVVQLINNVGVKMPEI
jgi:hypothetical protein